MLNAPEDQLIFEAYMSNQPTSLLGGKIKVSKAGDTTNVTVGRDVFPFKVDQGCIVVVQPDGQLSEEWDENLRDAITTACFKGQYNEKAVEDVITAIAKLIDPENAAQNDIDQAKMDRNSGKSSENTAQNKIDSARNKLK